MVMKRFTIISLLLSLTFAAGAQGIGSVKEFQEFIADCNGGSDLSRWVNADSVIVLTADLDLSKVKKLDAIASFGGRFDGGGHRIVGWKTDHGLFHEIQYGGVVKGIIIDKTCSMKVTSKTTEFALGFIADINNGQIENCENHAPITHKSGYTSNAVYIGGIAGQNGYVVLSCTNTGNISSDVNGEQRADLPAGVGGIFGGPSKKVLVGATAARCTNTGNIYVNSCINAVYAGGIGGNSAACTIKYSINRGSVKAESRLSDEGVNKTTSRVGGIVGQSKSDILTCDNFGDVTSLGTGGSNTGGIVGMPHAAMVIADCMNFGAVTSKGELPSQTGGIAGVAGRPVHFVGCVNYGAVTFDGISSRSRSCAGGIVGSTYVTKDAASGAYIRHCFNHGLVKASNGGNKYDATNNNCIHAGGIVGYFGCRNDIRGQVTDNGNDGPVSCPSGRRGEIAAWSDVKPTGSWPDDIAVKAAKPAPGAPTITGVVKTPEGQPLKGIPVTDGVQVTTTAADGSYSLVSDLSKVKFVSLSLPTNVRIPSRNSLPQFFKRIERYSDAVRADFTLETRPPYEDYTVIMIADPQVRPYGVDNSMETWVRDVAPDAEAFRASCTGDVFSINLGDLVYNYMYAWDDYLDGAAQVKCPTFNVIGNHDYDQANLFETAFGNVHYESYVGPDHFSFDLGKIHYVVVNTILYDRKNARQSYHYGLDDDTMTWLENDLALVPRDRIIVTCSHSSPFKHPGTSPNGSHGVYNLNYSKYLKLLSSFKEVYAWNGHYHKNFYYNYAGKNVRHGASNIQDISVARCTGALRLNKYFSAHGEPQGYMVMEVRGDDISWYYKPVGRDGSWQMKAYPPSRTGDGTVLANIWNWSEGWSIPEWYEGGTRVAAMEETTMIDPDYQIIYDGVTNKTTRKYCTPAEARMWKVTPTPGATGGEIRVTDMFGKTYTQTISWQ